MQKVLDSLFLDPGYTLHYNSTTSQRPKLTDPKDYKTVTGNNSFYTTKDVPDYTFYFRIFYNIDDSAGIINGENIIYTYYNNNDGKGTPDEYWVFEGYDSQYTNPKFAYNWLVTKINEYNQKKYGGDIADQLKLSSPPY